MKSLVSLLLAALSALVGGGLPPQYDVRLMAVADDYAEGAVVHLGNES